jgi:hypothetical protein
MDLSESFHIWRRQWKLTVALLILALVGAVAALTGLPRSYQSDATLILLASRSAARLNGSNPYLSFSPSLTLSADALSRELMAPQTAQSLAARGFPGAYTVTPALYATSTTGSALLVTVTGSSKAAVQSTLYAVDRQAGVELLRLQHGVTAANQIRSATLSYSPQPSLSVSQTARPLVIVVVLEALLVVAIPAMADGWMTRRRIGRRHALVPEQASESSG